MPPHTPSSLSRDKASVFTSTFRSGIESILGKRKSEQSPPPGTKRHATPKPPPQTYQEAVQVGNDPPPRSGHDSSSSDSDVDRSEHIDLVRPERAAGKYPLPTKLTSSLRPANDFPDPSHTSRKHTFQTRVVRRRRSVSTCEFTNNCAWDDVEHSDSKDAQRAALSDPRKLSLGYPVVYRIECSAKKHDTFFYEDDPWTAIFTDGRRSFHLSGKCPIYELQIYVRHFAQPSFVIVKNRACGNQIRMSNLREETMLILDDDLRQAFQKVTTCPLEGFVKYGALEFRAPYQFLHFHRELLHSYAQTVDARLRGKIEAVLRYMCSNYGKEYAETEELLTQHKITIRHLDKVFRPNQLVTIRPRRYNDVSSELGGVYVVKGWPTVRGAELSIQLWGWKFTQVECARNHMSYVFSAPVEDEDELFTIEHLGIYPISILSEKSIETLRDRGRKSWDLRRPKFVYCNGSDYLKPGRYMIDQITYAKLHPDGLGWSMGKESRNKQSDPWRLLVNFGDEPMHDDFLLMPTELPGYDLLEKEWIKLPVSDITPIRWSKQPFEDLVLPKETKRLVRAMVTVRASSIKTKRERLLRANYDIISGKGNGLIMLFHGSPGTGKTLTAESVAEIAEMPLYPITCGDIGTDPEKVEEYLRLVFELGSRWNCVLLLDEADVFLEERTLADLQRNSLVSVFLRMLEYYEGILILTSNRVGTFDEAFRSRINIALHYEDLKPHSRKLIWSNFLARLEGTEEGENVGDIENRLDELANHKLNGREIRNALSTARQLASYEGKVMGWEHLELAIKTANKFGNYLREVHGHSDRDWAKERRERL